MSTPSVPLVPIATLSLNGWVNSGAAKADFLFAWFLENEYSQSNLYYGKIASLSWLLMRYGQDPDALVSNMTQVLQTYLNRVYPEGVYVNCTHNANSLTNPSDQYAVQLIIEISENGLVKSFGRLINYTGGKAVSIINTNDTGNADTPGTAPEVSF
jgi:hypothetical protein